MAFAKLELSLIGRISNSALIVYTMMMNRSEYDIATDCRLLRYKIKTIAQMSNVSERCCKSCIAELERCGLLEHSRTGRSSFYILNDPECCYGAPRVTKKNYA